MFAGMPGGMPGGSPGSFPGGGPGGSPGADGGQPMMVQMDGGGGGGRGGRPGGAGGAPSEEQRKIRDAMRKALDGKKMDDLSADDQKKLMTKVRDDLAKQGVKLPAPGPDGPGGPGGGRGMPFGGPGMPMGFGGGSQFSEKELAGAKLPPPPEEDSQLDVLLRPGLLADVEIIVDEVKNALSLPMQAIFVKDGKPVVYIKKGSSFEPRFIQPLKRSETTMVISSGVTVGEIVALADPTEKKKDKKDKKEKGGGAMGALGQGGAK